MSFDLVVGIFPRPLLLFRGSLTGVTLLGGGFALPCYCFFKSILNKLRFTCKKKKTLTQISCSDESENFLVFFLSVYALFEGMCYS